jgi:hypothetical protein
VDLLFLFNSFIVGVTHSSKQVLVYMRDESGSYSLSKSIDSPNEVTALSLSGNLIVVATEPDHKIYSYEYGKEDQQFESLTTLSSRVTYMEFNDRYGKWLAICSFEKYILLLNVESKQNLKLEAPDIDGGFLFCSFDPIRKYLAAVSIDKSLVIWSNMTSEEPNMVTYVPGMKSSNELMDIWAKACPKEILTHVLPLRCSWYPQGKSFVLPSNSSDAIQLLKRDNWTDSKQLTSSKISYPYIFKFSPNGIYILIVSVTAVVVFALDPVTQSFVSDEPVLYQEQNSAITEAEWSQNSDEIYLSNFAGKCLIMNVPTTNGSSFKISANNTLLEQPVDFDEDFQFEHQSNASNNSSVSCMDIVLSDDEEYVASNDTKKPVNSTKESHTLSKENKKKPLNGSQSKQENPASVSKPVITLAKKEGKAAVINNEHNSIPCSPSTEETPLEFPSHSDSQISKKKRIYVAPFQPGSTQFSLSTGSKQFCYMAYTSFGKIRASCAAKQADSYFIEVTLTDIAKGGHHSYEDLYKPHIAALSEHGAAFASCSRASSGMRETIVLPSCIYYKPNSKGQKEWRYTMKTDERVDCIAAGYDQNCGFVAGATVWTREDEQEYYRLHIFDCLSGLPISLLILPNPVVSMVGHRNSLFIVYADEEAHLWFQLYDVKQGKVLRHDRLPLGKSIQLKWIGFSASGFPAIQAGDIVSMYVFQLDAWTPITSEPLISKAQTLYITDQKVFYVKLTSPNVISFDAAEQSRDITIPFPLEHTDRSAIADKKNKFLNTFLLQYYVACQHADEEQEADFKKTDRALFLFLYDIIDDKRYLDIEAIRYLLPFVRNNNTLEALKKAFAARQINFEALLPRKQTAISGKTAAESSLHYYIAQNQEILSTIQDLQAQLQHAQVKIKELCSNQSQFSEHLQATNAKQAHIGNGKTQPTVAPALEATNESSQEKDEPSSVEKSPLPDIFSPKRPKRVSKKNSAAASNKNDMALSEEKKDESTKPDKKRKRDEASGTPAVDAKKQKKTQTMLKFLDKKP